MSDNDDTFIAETIAGRHVYHWTPEFMERRAAKFAELKAAILPKLKPSANISKTPSDNLRKLNDLLRG